jgi:hypothetical protein
MTTNFKIIATLLKPALDASLDAIAIVDESNRIVYANVAMKNFLAVPARDFKKNPVFCDLVKFAACEKTCQMLHVIKSGEMVRLDETPAAKPNEKVRVLLKAVPLLNPEDPNASAPIGAIITVRDTTGEILLQAKYHKVMQLLGEKDTKINELMDRLNALRTALRRAREDATT